MPAKHNGRAARGDFQDAGGELVPRPHVTVIGMAVLAWNMAAIPEPERWEGMSPEFEEKLGNPAKAILNEMIARKLALYPEETRSILDYEITGGRDNMRVEVAFSLLPREIANLKHGKQVIQAR